MSVFYGLAVKTGNMVLQKFFVLYSFFAFSTLLLDVHVYTERADRELNADRVDVVVQL